MSEVKRLFNPEFLNRLDEIIVFNALADADLIQILELLVGQMNQNLAQKNISLTLSQEAGRWILDKTCADRSYGHGLCGARCKNMLKIRCRRL